MRALCKAIFLGLILSVCWWFLLFVYGVRRCVIRFRHGFAEALVYLDKQAHEACKIVKGGTGVCLSKWLGRA